MAQKNFFVEDLVYGRHEFTEPVLVELIESNAVQRLKKIGQYGVPDKYYHLKNFSRFDHDVGVAVLLAKSGASLEEQIAGMLHDVSHTAFSHVIDYVFGSTEKEDFQDNVFHEFLISSDANRILVENGYSPNDFSDLSKFTLLEREIPEICADRLDYCLREIAFDGEAEKARRLFLSLRSRNDAFCFETASAAKEFAQEFMQRQEEHWSGFQARARYALLGKALKIALETGEIQKKDLFTDDETVLLILENSENPEIKRILSDLLEGRLPESLETRKKIRFIDPAVIHGNGMTKLSELDSDYRKKIEKYRNQKT
jgi:HD superfamily phosphohydrolase